MEKLTSKKQKKLNLGCGLDIRKSTATEEWVNLDVIKGKNVDVVHDLNRFPYPFRANTFDEIYASHVLEHVDDLINVMAELKRISKSGARVMIRVPHFSCGVSYRDPTHRRLFSYFTFDYFTDNCFYGLPKFTIARRKLNFTRFAFTPLNYVLNPLMNISPALYERFFCWMLPCAEVLAELRVIK